MSKSHHQIVREFIAGMAAGQVTDEMLTPDFSAWVSSAGTADKTAYQQGIALLPKVVEGEIAFTIHSLTAEDDRVIAEFSGDAKLTNGKTYHNDYLYLFRIRDGRVCHLAEYLDVIAMREILMPAMMEFVERSG